LQNQTGVQVAAARTIRELAQISVPLPLAIVDNLLLPAVLAALDDSKLAAGARLHSEFRHSSELLIPSSDTRCEWLDTVLCLLGRGEFCVSLLSPGAPRMHQMRPTP